LTEREGIGRVHSMYAKRKISRKRKGLGSWNKIHITGKKIKTKKDKQNSAIMGGFSPIASSNWGR